MKGISQSIRSIYGITAKEQNSFIKKYALDGFTLNVRSIKSWSQVPENVASAFWEEFGGDLTLLHECIKRNFSIKELAEVVDEATGLDPGLTVDDVFRMVITADDAAGDNYLEYSSVDAEPALMMKKGDNVISVEQALNIMDTTFYDDMRMNAISYQNHGVSLTEEITVPQDDAENFMNMVMQVSQGVGGVSGGKITFIVGIKTEQDSDDVSAVFEFDFSLDDKESTCTFSQAQAHTFLEAPYLVANNMVLTVKCVSTVDTIEVADGLDGFKTVPVEYMGGWIKGDISFNGTGTDFPAAIDSTDFSNNMELMVVDESVVYVNTEPFLFINDEEDELD